MGNTEGHGPACATPSPPGGKSNTKLPKFDENRTSCCSGKAVVCARREKTQEVTIAS